MPRVKEIKGKVIGFRAWKVDKDLALISASNIRYVWKRGVNDAECLWDHTIGQPGTMDHAAPANGCHCGFHSQYQIPTERIKYPLHDGLGNHYVETASVYGVIVAWGDIIFHRNQFRAEHVEIVCLISHDKMPEMQAVFTKMCAQKYGVPVVDVGHAESFAKEFGIFVNPSLAPKSSDFDFSTLHASILSGSQIWSNGFYQKSASAWQTPGWEPRWIGKTGIKSNPGTIPTPRATQDQEKFQAHLDKTLDQASRKHMARLKKIEETQRQNRQKRRKLR